MVEKCEGKKATPNYFFRIFQKKHAFKLQCGGSRNDLLHFLREFIHRQGIDFSKCLFEFPKSLTSMDHPTRHGDM
jgi:hypothetical protein